MSLLRTLRSRFLVVTLSVCLTCIRLAVARASSVGRASDPPRRDPPSERRGLLLRITTHDAAGANRCQILEVRRSFPYLRVRSLSTDAVPVAFEPVAMTAVGTAAELGTERIPGWLSSKIGSDPTWLASRTHAESAFESNSCVCSCTSCSSCWSCWSCFSCWNCCSCWSCWSCCSCYL